MQPISVPYQGYRLWELPPNSQGVAALEMLRLLETYDLKAMGHNSAAYLHHLIEAKKLAYADIEYYVGDAASMKSPAEGFLADEYIRKRSIRDFFYDRVAKSRYRIFGRVDACMLPPPEVRARFLS